jgi:hypothetical protein
VILVDTLVVLAVVVALVVFSLRPRKGKPK